MALPAVPASTSSLSLCYGHGVFISLIAFCNPTTVFRYGIPCARGFLPVSSTSSFPLCLSLLWSGCDWLLKGTCAGSSVPLWQHWEAMESCKILVLVGNAVCKPEYSCCFVGGVSCFPGKSLKCRILQKNPSPPLKEPVSPAPLLTSLAHTPFCFLVTLWCSVSAFIRKKSVSCWLDLLVTWRMGQMTLSLSQSIQTQVFHHSNIN